MRNSMRKPLMAVWQCARCDAQSLFLGSMILTDRPINADAHRVSAEREHQPPLACHLLRLVYPTAEDEKPTYMFISPLP